jgi:predicted anti-sigma-YlaC factor YlaD
VNPDCRDLERLVSLRASRAPDALDAADAARLDAHLAGCAACRAELEASATALSLAALPPPSEAERRAVRELPAGALAALRRKDRRRGVAKRALVGVAGVAVAAGLAMAVVAPALFRPQGVQVTFAETQDAQQGGDDAWQPDMDTLWADAQVVELDGNGSSAQSDGEASTSTDAALAALDY